jgi:hypothetical protein
MKYIVISSACPQVNLPAINTFASLEFARRFAEQFRPASIWECSGNTRQIAPNAIVHDVGTQPVEEVR